MRRATISTDSKPAPLVRRGATLFYGLLLVGSVAAGVLAWVNASREPAPVAEPPLAPVSAPDTLAATEGEPAGGPVPVLPAVPDLSARPARGPSAPSSTVTIEMRMLAHAHQLMADEPLAALEILEQHRAEFPEGQLAEAREASVIEALVRLERQGEAERRYYDFITRYPASESRARLVPLMQQ